MTYSEWLEWKEAEEKKWLEQIDKIPISLRTECFNKAFWRAYVRYIEEKYNEVVD